MPCLQRASLISSVNSGDQLDLVRSILILIALIVRVKGRLSGRNGGG